MTDINSEREGASRPPSWLADRRAWLLWKLEPGNPKPRKVPYYADGIKRHGELGGSADLARLVTYDEALEKATGDFRAGLAIVGGLAFVDLDECIVDGKPNALAERCARLTTDAVVEVSQSGLGLHIVGVSELAVSLNRSGRHGWEAYTYGRFCAWTGNLVSSGDAPVDLTELIESLPGYREQDEPETEAPERNARVQALYDNSLENLRGLLERLPNDDVSWDGYRNVLCAVRNTFTGKDAKEAKELFREWSAKSAKHEEKSTIDADWRAWKPKGAGRKYTMASLVRWANQGFIDDEAPAEAARAIVAPVIPAEPPRSRFPRPTGLLADVTAHILSNSRKPQPDAALLSALVTCAGVIGNRYRLPDNTRMNLYALLVGATGSGKDTPMSEPVRLAQAVNTADSKVVHDVKAFHGRMASGEALEDEMVATPNGLLWLHDESAHASIKGKLDPMRVGLDGTILKLWGASAGTCTTRNKANRQGQRQAGVILDQPYLCMLEATTPSALSMYLTPAAIGQGRFGRMLFAELPYLEPRRLKEWHPVPDELAARLAALRRSGMTTVPWSSAADPMVDAWTIELDRLANDAATEAGQAVRQRSMEKIQRVALLLAVLDEMDAPEVTVAHLEWARALVEASDGYAASDLTEALSDDAQEEQRLRIKACFKKLLTGKVKLRNAQQENARQQGFVVRSALLRHSRLDAKTFDLALATLVQTGELAKANASKLGFDTESGNDPELVYLPEQAD